MKLKKIIAGILALVLVVTMVPLENLLGSTEETASAQPVTYTATDSQYVLGNNTSDQGSYLSTSLGDLRWNHPSLYDEPYGIYTQNDSSKNNSLGVEESTYRWAYIAMKVSVETDGTYNLSVAVNSNKSATYNTFGMLVDGIMHELSYDKSSSKATVDTTVTLSAGTHIIVFTTAMPADSEVAKDLGTGNASAYPWFNFHSVTLGVGLKAEAKPTKQEVIDSVLTRVEAEDTSKVTYNGYTSTADTSNKYASDGKLIGGVKKSALTQSATDIGNYLDKNGNAYLQYIVEAPKDGLYNLRLGAYVGAGGSVNTSSVAMPKATLIVNNNQVIQQDYDGAWNSLCTANFVVELKEGRNIIRTVALTTEQECFSVSCWVNQDYLDIDKNLTVLECGTAGTVAAGDETKVLANQYTDNGDTLGSAVTGPIQSDKPSIETIEYAGQEIGTYPWAAMKVSAPKDGYYDITVNLGTKSGATSTQIAMLVDGEAAAKSYTKADSAAVDCTVYLKAGTHTLVFTLPMPKTSAEAANANIWNAYPWCNYNSFVIDSSLTITDLPTLEEIMLDLYSNVSAADESKVTYAYLTNDGSKLKDRDYTNMQYDHATIETLPYAGNKIQGWPYAAICVNAETEGDYEIAISAASKSAKKFGLIVDGDVYSLDYTDAGKTQEISTEVHLTKGNHVLIFTSAIPENVSGVDDSKNIWDIYTWTDINYIVLDRGIALLEKPQAELIGSQLGNTYDAIDATRVIYDNYTNCVIDENKEDDELVIEKIASPNSDYLKENRISLETLLDAGWERAPYTALEVTVDEAGYYDVYATVATRGDLKSEQLGMIIDGDEVKVVKVEAKAGKQIVGDTIYLEEGTHLIAFTSPMPLDNEAAQAITDPNEDNWTDMSKSYPWFDVYEFYFAKEVTVSNNADVEATTVNVMETSKVSKNWSTYKDSNDEDETADYLGANTDDYKYNRVSVETVLESDLGRLPYVSVTVTAEADGYYDIYATIMTNGNITSKCAAMIVDGTTVYPISIAGTGSKQDIGAFIPLTKGTHTIAITSAMPKTDAEAQAITDPKEDSWTDMNKAYPWFDVYSVTVNGRLSIVEGSENPLIDKSVLFIGDDITNSENSWVSKIGTWNHMDWTNAGISGATIAAVGAKHIIHQLKANSANDYDYVIMHGGINDAMSEVEIGEVSESYDVADFDNETYIGALETMFYYAYDNFEGANFGYIINYATPNSGMGGYTQDMKAYFDEAKEACVKWNVSYIDLYEGMVAAGGEELSYSYDILQVDKSADIFLNKNQEEIHLSDEGYKIITPYIEAWMMTIGSNANPLEPDNRVKYVDAGDETKVLSNGFTVSDGTLVDRVNTGMAEDEANIELLPYAKDMLGDWAYASIKVNAKETGNYKIMVEMSARNATQMGMLVDGEVYTLNYSKQDGFCQFMEQTVYLTAGTHYVTFTSAMPKDTVDVMGAAWEVYPWTNIFTIVVDAKLEVMSKPELSEVTALLGTAADMGQTVVNAGNETEVLQNDFKDNGDTLGNMNAGDLRYDKLTLDKFTVDNLHYMPYTALKVNADADGYYDILLNIETNSKTISDQLGLLVDGKDVQVLEFNVASKTKVKATVYLTEGTHTLVFTSPMPETVAEFEAYLEEYNADKEDKDKLTIGDGITHPWVNFVSFTLGKGLTVESAPTVAEVEYPSYNRIEAENDKYVIYNGYKPEGEEASKASGGKVAGGVERWHIEQTFEELSTWIDASDSHMAYVEYAINAPADGEYIIRPGFIADVNKNVANRNKIAKPFAAVLVNDNIYKAQYTADWGETQAVAVKVELKKGLNIIRVTTYTADQEIFTVSSWINQDYLDLDKRLTAVERTATTVEAENSQYYHFLSVKDGSATEEASNGKVLGGAQLIRARGIGLTIDTLTTENLCMVPYYSYTVEAPMDGYYSLTMNMAGDGRLSESQIAMLVDGEVSTVKYNRAGKKTTDTKAIITVYLTKGEHVMTFTSPLPLNADELKKANWSYYWMNFDCITFHDGLKLASKQNAPIEIEDLVRIEAEDVGLPNMTKVTAAAEGEDAKEGYIGGAKYRRSQSVAEIKQNGIDARTTPFVQYTVRADEAGTYTVYFQGTYGIFNPSTDDLEMDATVAVEVNGEASFHTVHCKKASTQSIIPVTLKLAAGDNVVRVTHFTSDSITGAGYCWIDYNYIEMSAADAEKITFVPTTGVVEAERSEVVSYMTNSSSGSSGGECLGNANYKYIDGMDLTFANLDINALGEISRVTYTVVAEKAGTYNLAIQFNGGVTKYTFNELVEKGTIGFALSVNEGEKQLVEFCPDAGTGSISRIVEVDLKEGENKIMVTATLADYLSGINPYIEDEYRIYWIDHDSLRLTAGVNATDMNVEPYDVNNTDVNYAQLAARKPSAPIVEEPEDNSIAAVVGIIAGSAVAVLALFIVILILKKRKKEKAEG